MAARRLLAVALAVVLAGCGSTTVHRAPRPVHRRAPPRGSAVSVLLSTRSAGLRTMPDLRFTRGKPGSGETIQVDPGVRYQRFGAVGAALTDSSAWLMEDELTPARRARLLSNLFGPAGIRLGILRLPMGASDFTRNGVPYTYDDVPRGQSDPTLARFSIGHDESYTIPLLRRIRALEPGIELISSPWSPPAWMKANDRLSNLGERGTLLASAYPAFAHYFVRFLKAYAAAGIPIDAITPANEPGQIATYPSINLPERSQARFITRYLAPALAAAHLHQLVYGFDYKWLLASEAVALVGSPSVEGVLHGIAWHCYDGNPDVMTTMHQLAPELDQIENECASGAAPGPPSEMMIASLRNWASSAVLWNLALNPQRGPVQPPNFGCSKCIGVLTVDPATRTVRYGSDYAALGQFSMVIDRGAYRIGSNHFVTYMGNTHEHHTTYATAGLDDVAFRNPDGTIALVAYNNGRRAVAFAVRTAGASFRYTLAAGATVSFTWR